MTGLAVFVIVSITKLVGSELATITDRIGPSYYSQ